MDNFVSLVMPVFNVEKYLHECIDSILNQTYSLFELIVIDDGSTDSSAAIIKEYAQKDNRIKAFYQKNAGVSYTRNMGMQKATGKYIIFVDADDVLPLDSLEKRVKAIGNADMVVGRYSVLNKIDGLIDSPLSLNDSWGKIEAIRNIVTGGLLGYQGYIWNKLYRRTIIEENNLRFAPGLAYNEDRLFNMYYLSKCESIKWTNNIVYIYRSNDESAMGRRKGMTDKDAALLLSEFTAFDKMLDIAKEIDEDLCRDIALNAMNRARSLCMEFNSQELKRTRCRLRWFVRMYGFFALKHCSFNMPVIKVAKILGHVVLGR